jgi:hypothetical protein
MTVPTSTAKSGPYAGSGTTGPFTVGFRFLENSHIQVIRTSSTGVDTTLALTTDYTVSGAGGASGSVTLVTALAVGQQLTIIRNVPFTQDADYVQNDAFPAESHERSLDKLTMQTQQLLEAVDRAAKLPVTSTADAEELVADITLLADNIAGLTAVYSAIPAITIVANDLTEPVSEINTVAGSIANVDAVGSNIANVNTVAGVSANVTTVATNIASVNSAATNMTAIIAAPSNAAAAAASAAAAAASAASGMYSAVIDKSANYTVVAGDAGDLIRVTTTGGAVTITLPLISTQVDGFKVAIVKWTGDANQVTIARSGSDTINGTTSATIGSQYTSTTFVADFETSQWLAVTSGLGSTNVVVDRFSGTGSLDIFTLSGSPGSPNNTYVFVGGVYQQKNTYSLSGTTLTFSAAPPSGTDNIEVVWTQPMAVGVPSDGTVTPAKLSTGGPFWDASGDVGIGTSSPASRLDVGGQTNTEVRVQTTASATAGDASLLLIGGRNTDAQIGRVRFYNNTTGSNVELSRVQSSREGANDAANLQFFTRPAGGSITERARIDSSGQMWTQNGAGSVVRAYDCRAWVNFNGTGTVAIRASGNVTSITDNGTGDYTVNFTAAMPDANYEVNASISPSYGVGNAAAINMFSSGLTEQAPTTTAFRFSCSPESGGYFDPKYVSMSVFR